MTKKLLSIFAAISLVAFGAIPSAHALGGGYLGKTQGGWMSTSYQFSQLLGKDVRGIDGQKLGTVNDFVMDRSGHVFALVNSPDTGKTIIVPSQAFSQMGPDNTLTLNFTRDQWAKAPEFDRALLANRGWSRDIYRQYGMQPSWSYQGGMPQSSVPSQRIARSSDFRSAFGSYDVKQLLGRDVKGVNGEHVGNIRDFIIDPNGHIFALLSSADTGKTVAVPFEAFSSLGRESLHLNVSRDQLAGLPEFHQGTLRDRSWSQSIYRQYGIQPGFSSGTINQSGASSQIQSGAYYPGIQRQGKPTSFDLNALSGKDVKGVNDQTIGSIQNFVIDPSGRVFAVVNSTDTGKNVALPFEAFSYVGPNNDLHVNVSKDQLASAPEFDRARLADRTWTEDVYRQFGIQPSFSTSDTRSGIDQMYPENPDLLSPPE